VPAFDVPAAPGLRVSVLDLGLACCAVEFAAAVARGLLVEPAPDAGDPDLTVLVVSGTVTDALVPAVLSAYDALTGPVAVVSFGACSNTGGPYWDSYAVTKGVDQVLPVRAYVPGCPPRPEALVDGLRAVREQVLAGEPR
jgi:NADH-quinone oxidoreductase subunit B